jgi:hypothetical protein
MAKTGSQSDFHEAMDFPSISDMVPVTLHR